MKRAAPDYIDGWYDSDATRMTHAPPPEVTKRLMIRNEKIHHPRIRDTSARISSALEAAEGAIVSALLKLQPTADNNGRNNAAGGVRCSKGALHYVW